MEIVGTYKKLMGLDENVIEIYKILPNDWSDNDAMIIARFAWDGMYRNVPNDRDGNTMVYQQVVRQAESMLQNTKHQATYSTRAQKYLEGYQAEAAKRLEKIE